MEQLQYAITPEVCQAVQQRGYAVVEGVFDGTWCSRLRGEIQALRKAGALHLNSTHLVKGSNRQLLEKANIWESELMQEASLAYPLKCCRPVGLFAWRHLACMAGSRKGCSPERESTDQEVSVWSPELMQRSRPWQVSTVEDKGHAIT